jgi:hypothetical protein
MVLGLKPERRGMGRRIPQKSYYKKKALVAVLIK